MDLALGLICEEISGKMLAGSPGLDIHSIATDSRKAEQGSLFFALTGDSHDGHDFVNQALQAGASAAVISRFPDLTELPAGKAVIQVEDTLQALQDLAAYYRSRFDIPVIAVTGSVGKTTTKEMIYHCLSTVMRTVKTEGNFNNDIGLPLTIFRWEREHQAAVVELAMRGAGEISRLGKVARPNCAVITNVEAVHLENLGRIEMVAQAKSEILASLKEDEWALINGDNEVLLQAASRYNCRKYTFGYNQKCDFRIEAVESYPGGMHVDMVLKGKPARFHFALPARRLAPNIAACAGVSSLLGIDIEAIQAGLKAYKPYGNRLNIVRLAEGGAVINDTYNANPLSMFAALETGREIAATGRLIAVLGDMFELGDYEVQGHMEVGRKAGEIDLDVLITIGDRAAYISRAALESGMAPGKVHHFAHKNDSWNFIQQIFDKKDTIIFKASRGMQLETLADNVLVQKKS